MQFNTKDLSGNAQTQEMFAEHELTLVNVWATWCSPCIEELPILDKIYQEGEIGVVGIVIESRDDDVADFAAGILKKSGATYPVLRVTEEMEKSFLSGIDAMPTTFLWMERGNVVGGLYIGAREELEWRDTIASVQEKLHEEKIGVWLVALLFFTGALLMFAGVYRGEIKIVLMKATTICLECIGIG